MTISSCVRATWWALDLIQKKITIPKVPCQFLGNTLDPWHELLNFIDDDLFV